HLPVVMATGLSVEFCAHIARAYTESYKKTRDEKVKQCMIEMGSSIMNGGLSTLVGVLALAFAQYNLLQVYYFRLVCKYWMFFAFKSLLQDVFRRNGRWNTSWTRDFACCSFVDRTLANKI